MERRIGLLQRRQSVDGHGVGAAGQWRDPNEPVCRGADSFATARLYARKARPKLFPRVPPRLARHM